MAQIYEDDDSEDIPKAPNLGRLKNGWRDDFESEFGRNRLNPRKLGAIMRAADNGDTEALHEMFSAIEEDPHVGSVLGKRRRAVAARKILIEPSADTPEAQRSADLCNQLVFGMDGEGGIENLAEAIFDATDAIGRAYSIQQIIWQREESLFIPQRIEYWPQRDTVIGDPFIAGRGRHQRDQEIRILTDDNPVRGEEPEAGQWLIHINKSRSGGLHKTALLRWVAWFYLFKHFSIKDWSIWAERYGMPFRIGKYPKHANKEERDAVLNAIISIGKDGGAIMPVDAMIELVHAQASGDLPYEALAQLCNNEISKAILGNTLTTEVGSTSGNRALGEVHERQQSEFGDEDSQRLARDLRQHLCRPIVRFNIGEAAPVPTVKLIPEKSEGTKQDAERDAILVRDVGLPVDVKYFYDRYSIPEPEEDAVLVSPNGGMTELAGLMNSADDA